MRNSEFTREIIYEAFFPSEKRFHINCAIAEKAVDNAKITIDSNEELIDIMLFYVETGSDFMNEFDGIDEDVCTNLENTFEEALQKIVENNLEEKFKSRCKEIAENSNEGYGFSDYLRENFEIYFYPKTK